MAKNYVVKIAEEMMNLKILFSSLIIDTYIQIIANYLINYKNYHFLFTFGERLVVRRLI
jgi:hypothetical protein